MPKHQPEQAEPMMEQGGEQSPIELDETAPLDELTQTQNELAQVQDQLLRLAAEYDNYRKRTAKELDVRYADAKVFTVAALLPAFDNLERAAGAQNVTLEDLAKGVALTLKQLNEIFITLGVEAVGELGEIFDPNLHNAVLHIQDETLGENVVAQVLQKGYKCGDKVIRHAVVSVAN